jgi:hypothetical protein
VPNQAKKPAARPRERRDNERRDPGRGVWALGQVRHTGISLMHDAEVRPDITMREAGHADRAVHARYTHALDEAYRQAAEQVAAAAMSAAWTSSGPEMASRQEPCLRQGLARATKQTEHEAARRSASRPDVRFDVILDAVGRMKTSRLKEACRRALSPAGRYVSIDDSALKLDSGRLAVLKDLVEAVTSSEGHKKGGVPITI